MARYTVCACERRVYACKMTCTYVNAWVGDARELASNSLQIAGLSIVRSLAPAAIAHNCCPSTTRAYTYILLHCI